MSSPDDVPPHSPPPPPAFNKISLLSSIDFSKYKHICFISSIVEDSSTFSQYLNGDTYPVIYNSHADRDHLKTSLLSQFTAIDRISFVFHGPTSESASSSFTTRFIQGDMFFTVDENQAVVVGENHVFIQELCTTLHVKNVDFLACNLLQSQEWKNYFALFPSNVVVGASLDNTGNLKYGGDWVMENTMEDIRDIYLNKNLIDNFAGLLLTYSLQVNGTTRTFTYTLDANNYVTITGISANWTGELSIPATINGNPVKTVTGLSGNVFSSLIIPVGVTTIGTSAAQNSASLTSVSLPIGLTVIGFFAFAGCTNLVTINLPEGLLVISSRAFYYSAVNAQIPTTVTTIGEYAFDGATFTSITIPASVTTWVVGGNKFGNCRQLETITFAPGCTIIPDLLFIDCAKVRYINIPNTVKTIGEGAFLGCGSAATPLKVVINSSVTTIGPNAFAYSKISALYFGGNMLPSFTNNLTKQPFNNNGFTPLNTYHLPTVTNTSVLAGFSDPTHNFIPLTTSAMFTQMKADSVSLFGIYNAGFLTIEYLKTQYTIAEMYTAGISVGQLYAGGITFAEILAAVPSVASNLASIIKSNPSAYVPSIPTVVGTTVSLPSISTLDLTDTAIIGNTVADQKSFTSATVKSLFSANNAQKQLKLPVGSVLPGFSQSLTSEVYLINASSSVANKKVALLPKSEIVGKIFYILLEAGDAITLQTHNGTVAVSKSGSVFTLTPSTGSAVTKVSGETYSYDGLVVTLGSVYGTLNPTSVNFVLTALNSQFQLSTAGAIPIYTPTLTSDAVITLNTTVSADVMQNTFFYRTDRDITLDASFVYYYVDSSKWTNQSTVLNPKNGVVTTNMYVAEDGVGKDFLRDLAKQLFGTYLGADLFTNEDSVITDIHVKCDSVATYAVALINSIDKTAGTSTLLKTDLSGGKYLDDNVSTSNISRELFNQLITTAPTRFTDTKPQKYNAEEDGFYKLPILQGDTITFKMTISPATTQTAAVPTGPTSLLSRSYKVVMNVGGT